MVICVRYYFMAGFLTGAFFNDAPVIEFFAALAALAAN
jgi:hypothetical protein